MDLKNTEQTIDALWEILDQNKVIEEANRCIKAAHETAMQLGVKTYIKGLNHKKLEEAMSSEQACKQLIIELETMVFSVLNNYDRGSYISRNTSISDDGYRRRILVDYETIPVPRQRKPEMCIEDNHWGP